MPLPSCCNNPEPEPNGPDDNTVDVRLERIDCILDDSKNGTLLEVFGIDPPCLLDDSKGDFFGKLKKLLLNMEEF